VAYLRYRRYRYGSLMALVGVSALYDDFSSATFKSPLWDHRYGDVVLYNGYARVGCAHTGGIPVYSALYTPGPVPADTWTLAGSTLFGRFAELPVAGIAPVAYASVNVLSAVPGTYLGFFYDAVSSYISAGNHVSWADPGVVAWPYTPDSSWFRVDHDGVNVTWRTSPDGKTWVTRRTEPVAVWMASDVALSCQAVRTGGTNDYAGFDNLNVYDCVVTPSRIGIATVVPTPSMSIGTTPTPPRMNLMTTLPYPHIVATHIIPPQTNATVTTRGLSGRATTHALRGSASA